MSVKKGPVIGISVGDLNGIGIELIIKTFADSRITEFCTPIVFGSNKVINFYRKSMPELNINYNNIKEIAKANPKQLNIFSAWEEDVEIQPGQAEPMKLMRSLQHHSINIPCKVVTSILQAILLI
jgi:4-hydroxythreonine-4-phosphate dehydrogenase